jgi:endonuclease III
VPITPLKQYGRRFSPASVRIIRMNDTCQQPETSNSLSRERRSLETLHRLESEYGKDEWVASGRPIDELVATILSQNTSDTNTDRALSALRQRFPTWEDVRDAPVDAVVDSIRAGGLAEQKAPRIQHALAEILSKDESDQNERFLTELRELGLQRSMERLTSMPGVGPKTAACVLLFAAGLPALPVDTHVYRVAKRLGLIPSGMDANRAHEELRRQIPPSHVYQFHMHMIRHGRQVCRARNPRCEICVLSDICQYRLGLVEST